MYHFFVSPEQIGEAVITITGTDVNHIKNVLRMGIGEQIAIRNGQDNREYCCEIVAFKEQQITTKIMAVAEQEVELSSRIYLFQGLPKSDKMELIIQKAVELGVFEIIPVATKRSVVKLDAQKEKNKLIRWQGIAASAAKQSKRRLIPEVKAVMDFKAAVTFAESLEVVLLPYELAKGMEQTRAIIETINPGQSIGIFIGPEGGFTEEEVAFGAACGAQQITLGKRILRTETAGLTLLSILMFYLEA